MWYSWYETRACLNSILRIRCGYPGRKNQEKEGEGVGLTLDIPLVADHQMLPRSGRLCARCRGAARRTLQTAQRAGALDANNRLWRGLRENIVSKPLSSCRNPQPAPKCS